MNFPSSQTTLGALGILVMGTLGGAVIFAPAPSSSHDVILVIVSALAGALSAGSPKPPTAL